MRSDQSAARTEGKGPARRSEWVRRVASRLRALVGGERKRRQPAAERVDVDVNVEPPADEVDEAGLESFPASDPPNWTLGHERRR